MATIERLQYITNGSNREEVREEVTKYLEGSGKWVQLRMKDCEMGELVATIELLKVLCGQYGATLILNDDVALCKAMDCDGVHIGQSDLSPMSARTILGEGKIIGFTCNSGDQIEMACAMGVVDYLGVGPLRFTTTKKNLSPQIGLENYFELVRRSNLPIVAVGGVKSSDIESLKKQGVWGVAVSGEISRATNPSATTKEFIEEISEL